MKCYTVKYQQALRDIYPQGIRSSFVNTFIGLTERETAKLVRLRFLFTTRKYFLYNLIPSCKR